MIALSNQLKGNWQMTKRTDPKKQRMMDQLLANDNEHDKWMTRLFRASHRLETIRNTRKRLQREIAKRLTAA